MKYFAIPGRVKMRKIVAIFLMCFFIAGILYARDTLKTGFIVPLTGDVKTFGESAKNGFTITLEEYAKKGKYNINMAIADDKNDPIE